jgi:hypothetical protein
MSAYAEVRRVANEEIIPELYPRSDIEFIGAAMTLRVVAL